VIERTTCCAVRCRAAADLIPLQHNIQKSSILIVNRVTTKPHHLLPEVVAPLFCWVFDSTVCLTQSSLLIYPETSNLQSFKDINIVITIRSHIRIKRKNNWQKNKNYGLCSLFPVPTKENAVWTYYLIIECGALKFYEHIPFFFSFLFCSKWSTPLLIVWLAIALFSPENIA
jgi:hypothetical protein